MSVSVQLALIKQQLQAKQHKMEAAAPQPWLHCCSVEDLLGLTAEPLRRSQLFASLRVPDP